MVLGDAVTKLQSDICMDLKLCFKSHNLIPVQLWSTKPAQPTSLNMIIYMVGSVYQLV